MSIIIQYGINNGLEFEIPFEFIKNQRNSKMAHQICEFYLQGDNKCCFGNGCKKLHIDRDYFQNHVAQKIMEYIQKSKKSDEDNEAILKYNNEFLDKEEESSENENDFNAKKSNKNYGKKKRKSPTTTCFFFNSNGCWSSS